MSRALVRGPRAGKCSTRRRPSAPTVGRSGALTSCYSAVRHSRPPTGTGARAEPATGWANRLARFAHQLPTEPWRRVTSRRALPPRLDVFPSFFGVSRKTPPVLGGSVKSSRPDRKVGKRASYRRAGLGLRRRQGREPNALHRQPLIDHERHLSLEPRSVSEQFPHHRCVVSCRVIRLTDDCPDPADSIAG